MEKQEILKNQSGSLTLFFIPLLSCCLLLLLITFQKAKLRNLRLRERMKMYLCERELSTSLISYVNNVSRYDHLIRIAFFAQFTPNPAVSIPAKTTLKLMKLLQVKEHLSHLKNIYSSFYCTRMQKIVYLKSPFQMSGITYKRYPDQTTKLKRRKWKIILPPSSIRTGYLQTHYHFNGLKTIKSTKDFSLQALSPLN